MTRKSSINAWVTESSLNKFTNYQQAVDNYIVGSIFVSTSSATVANTVTETSIIGTGSGTLTLPANFFTIGKTLKFTLYGMIATLVTPTLRIKVKLGATVIIDTTAATLATITGTNLFFTEWMLTCRTTGAGGTVFGQGLAFYFTGITGLSGIASPSTATSSIDTTTTQVFDISVTWGTASASNTITSTNFVLNAMI